MCGIGGILHANREHNVRDRDLTALRNRGPDDEDLLIDGTFGFMHTRLAILELWARVCSDGDGPKGVPLG